MPGVAQRPPLSVLLDRPVVGDEEDRQQHIDWARFGFHQYYGNGQARPLLRGWVHILSLVVLECVLAANMLPGQAADLMRWSSVGLYGSVVFHIVPWTSLPAYQLALFADFVAIRCGRAN